MFVIGNAIGLFIGLGLLAWLLDRDTDATLRYKDEIALQRALREIEAEKRRGEL